MTSNALPEGLSRAVALTLRIGTGLAALLMIVGVALVIAHGPSDPLAGPTHVSLASLPHDLERGDATAFLLLGVLVLLFTPLARVMLSMIEFARNRDAPFTLITASVLAALTAGVVLGLSP